MANATVPTPASDFLLPRQLPTWQEQLAETQRKLEAENRKSEQEFLNDPEAQAEYQAWCESVDRMPSDEELDHMAAEYELSQGCLIGLNTNHDDIWQVGGSV